MSDQMVPPPPPPPSSSGGGFDANAAVDQFKGADPLDLAVVGAGVLAFVFSMFDWFSFSIPSYSVSGYTVGGGSVSASAYHGFWSPVGVWLLIGAGVVMALKIVKIAVPNQEMLVTVLAVAGALFVFIAMFQYGGAGDKGFSYWIVLIAGLASGGISGLKFAKARGLVK